MESSFQQSGELALEPAVAGAGAPDAELARKLWTAAEGASCGLTVQEFAETLERVGSKLRFGQGSVHTAAPQAADAVERERFWRALRLPELALAQACALGRDAAWERFVKEYRGPLAQAAIAITGSATLGRELADSLLAELFGLRESGGVRRSPLAGYTGRGSLMGWLRTTLAQRHVDHHRRTYRETPLDDIEPAASAPQATPGTELTLVAKMLEKTLQALTAEERYLLAAYFLDRQTLQVLGTTLRVHEATVSRRLKRLVETLRQHLLANLEGPPACLSRRAAQEALGTDPRDLEINLRAILQGSQLPPFSEEKASTAGEEDRA